MTGSQTERGDFWVGGEPDGPPVSLEVEPRLASWDVRTHKSQVALREFLDCAASAAESVPSQDQEAVLLTVGLPDAIPLTSGGRDLDNFLLPVAHRLTHRRFRSVFGEKRRGPSTLTIGSVGPPPDLGGWSFSSAESGLSAQSGPWKEEIAAQVPVVESGDGAIELHVSFRVSPARNWTSLWKPTIDSLGGILGVENMNSPFHPRDDRITRLGLHLQPDELQEWRVAIGVFWRVI